MLYFNSDLEFLEERIMNLNDLTAQYAQYVVRQAGSESGVIGKKNGHNRFILIIQNPDGSRDGAIYRVQPAENEGKLYRDLMTDFEPTDQSFAGIVKGAPCYQREDLGPDFWLEEF